jgi:hypothetical protein
MQINAKYKLNLTFPLKIFLQLCSNTQYLKFYLSFIDLLNQKP